jgi:DNA repair exonuclease SbcCD ATPase subunit
VESDLPPYLFPLEESRKESGPWIRETSEAQMRPYNLLPSLLLLSVVVFVEIWGSTADEAVEAVTAPLLREIERLKERLETYEMKFDTLEAATEQFRLKAKSSMQKLEDERNRYDILSTEKKLLETEFEIRLDDMVIEKTKHFEIYKKEQETKRKNLEETMQQLYQQIEESKQRQELLVQDLSTKMANERERYNVLERSKVSVEENLKRDIDVLSERLQNSEQQALSLDQTLQAALADEKERDSFRQKELRMCMDEANQLEIRVEELNEEKKNISVLLNQTTLKLDASDEMASKLQQKLTATENHLLASEETLQAVTSDFHAEKIENSKLRSVIKDSQQRLVAVELQARTLAGEKNTTLTAYDDAMKQLALEREKQNKTVATVIDLQEKASECTSLKEKLHNVENKLKATETQSIHCTETFESMRSQYAGLDRNISGLQTILDEKSRSLKECEDSLTSGKEELRELFLAMEGVTNRTIFLKEQSILKDQQIETITTRFVDLEAAAISHHQDLAALRSHHAELTAEYEFEKKKRILAEHSLSEMRVEVVACNEVLNETRSQCKKLEEETSRHRSNLAESTAKLAGLREELGTTKQLLEESRAEEGKASPGEGTSTKVLEVTKSVLRKIDYSLYQVLRFVVESPGYVTNFFQVPVFRNSLSWDAFTAPLLAMCLRSHGLFVSALQWSLTAVTCLIETSADTSPSTWKSMAKNAVAFILDNTQIIACLSEAIVGLLCMDFALSTILRYQSRGRRKLPSAINSKSAECGSLLRKAKKFQK